MPRKKIPPTAPEKCPDCKGDGTVTVPVMVGRGQRRRQVADQEAVCITCLTT